MNKVEFQYLVNTKQNKEIAELVTEYTISTKDKNVLFCAETIEILNDLLVYLDKMATNKDKEFKKLFKAKKPYTIKDAIEALKLNIMLSYIGSLEE